MRDVLDANPVQNDKLALCQEAIGYSFHNPRLLQAALTHASSADSRLASNERMEFLGDAVLGLLVCERVYERFPDFLEGDMTRIKSAVVSRRTCAAISRQLGLGSFLIMGKGLSVVPANMLADLYESLVCAVYLDGGLEAARTWVLGHLGEEIDRVAEDTHAGNHKSVLQELAQREYGSTPNYFLMDEKGPEHSKCFKVAAAVGRLTFPGAWGRTKKEAEQKAALNAISWINGGELPYPAD
ncbi:MAG TPA: ribonuclease III [Gemmatales bacterium]|nr:ribonuclease III [Gemmatales bacterium]HMP60685.1 ribonuclease III [Gemmatales bacterium]